MVLDALGLREFWTGLVGFAVAFSVRAGAIRYGWNLPAFPGRGNPPGA